MALRKTLGVQLIIYLLDGEPFYHGYGKKFSEDELTLRVWKMPTRDLSGKSIFIPLYITKENGFLLLRSEIFHRLYQLGPENVLRIPAGVRGVSVSDFKISNSWNPQVRTIKRQKEPICWWLLRRPLLQFLPLTMRFPLAPIAHSVNSPLQCTRLQTFLKEAPRI